jgi:hypothetical protein
MYPAFLYFLMFRALLRPYTLFTGADTCLKLDCELGGRHFGFE